MIIKKNITIFNINFFHISQIDGKLLCWLCTLSYKRALAKARQVETDRRMCKKRPSTDCKLKDNGKKQSTGQQQQSQSQSQRQQQQDQRGGGGGQQDKQILPEIPEKVVRNVNSGSMDQNSSEHVVAMTQLKEQIASLQKKLQQKDREILSKDKFTTELKGKNFECENELRNKMKDSEKYYESKIEVLNKKIAGLLKEVAQLSKGTKRGGLTAGKDNAVASAGGKDSGGSGTDSPSTN